MSKALVIAGEMTPGGQRATAVWDDASDDLPFTDPENHLNRVKFHDRLNYLRVVSEHVHTVNFAARGAPGFTGSYTMFAHGLSGIPLVFGACVIGGQPLCFTGSVPVQVDAVFRGRWARWVTIGADATNVYLYEYGRLPGGYSLPAMSLVVTTWVTNRIYPP